MGGKEMQMRRSGVGSGGGIGMNKQVNSRNPKVEPRARGINPGYAGQLGEMEGSHSTDGRETGYRGTPMSAKRAYNAPGMISDPVKAVGVGGGRTVHHCGSQGVQGPVDPGDPRPNPRHDALENQ
jgi:hypothetical protein